MGQLWCEHDDHLDMDDEHVPATWQRQPCFDGEADCPATGFGMCLCDEHARALQGICGRCFERMEELP